MIKNKFSNNLFFVLRSILLAIVLYAFTDAQFAHSQAVIYAEHWTSQETNADLVITPTGTGVARVRGGLLVNPAAVPSELAPKVDTATMNTYSGQSKVVYNTDDEEYYFHNGTTWATLGSGGAGSGISMWVTATSYSIDDVVIESEKIYVALTNHTSTVFQTDYGNGDWQEISAIDFTNNPVTGDLQEEHGGTGADLSASAVGTLFYQASASTMGPVNGIVINSTDGITANHSLTPANPGGGQTNTQHYFQTAVAPSNDATNLDQGSVEIRNDYSGPNDINAITALYLISNLGSGGDVQNAKLISGSLELGDGSNGGTVDTADMFNIYMNANDGFSVSNNMNGMALGLGSDATASVSNATGASLNLNFTGPITNGVTGINLGISGDDLIGYVNFINASGDIDGGVTGPINGVNISPNINTAFGGYNGFYTNPSINVNSNGFVGTFIGGAGTGQVDNYIGLQVNPVFADGGDFLKGASISLTPDSAVNTTGADIQISGDSVDSSGVSINMTGANTVSATGLNVNVSSATVTAGGTSRPISISANGGTVQFNSGYTIPNSGAFDAGNSFVMLGSIASGSPVTADFIAQSMPFVFNFSDDMSDGPLSIGAANVGYVSQVNGTPGSTIDNYSLAVAAVADAASTGGTITNLMGYRSKGALNLGGSLGGVTNLYHFRAQEGTIAPTNVWGISVEDTTAENFFEKSVAIGTTTKKVLNSDVGLEIEGKVIKLPEFETADLPAIAEHEAMFAYDISEHNPVYFDGTDWVHLTAGGGGGFDQDLNTTDAVTFAGITNSALTSGRVTFAGAAGLLTDDAGLTYNSGTDALTVTGSVTSAAITDSGLTATRVTFAGVGGLLSDDAGLTYDFVNNRQTVGQLEVGDLASGSVVYAAASGRLETEAALAYNSGTNAFTVGGEVRGTTLKGDNLTAGRVVIAGTAGQLTDDAGMTYDTAGDHLSVGAIYSTSTTIPSTPNNLVTTAQRTAMTPSVGSCVYDTDLRTQLCYDGANWAIQGVQPADTTWTSYTPTFNGFTASDIECQYKYEAQDQLISCKFTVTGTSAAPALVGLGGGATSAGTSIIPSPRKGGDWVIAATTTSHGGVVIVEPNVTYVSFGSDGTFSNVNVNPMTAQNGSTIFGTNSYNFTARVPVAGRAATIGTYSIPALGDTFSAQVSATGVVSNENSDFINGNCTNANPSVCTFTTSPSYFTVAPNCVANSSNTSAVLAITTPVTSTSTTVTIQQNATAVATQEPFVLVCQKQGVDWAMAHTITASLKDVVTATSTPNGLPKICSFQGNTSTDVASNEIGDCLNGTTCTDATANRFTCPFNSGYFSTQVNCTCTEQSANSTWANIVTVSTSSVTVRGVLHDGSGSDVTPFCTCVGY